MLIIAAFLFSCAIDIPIDDDTGYPPFSGGDTLDIMTWNLQLFPKNGTATITYLENAINRIKPDIIAMQEVQSLTSLQTLANRLGHYAYAKADGGGDWGLAYLYNTNTVSLMTTPYEIYTHNSRPFPRPPFVMEANWNGQKVVIIDNHLKASGDGVIDLSDSYDEETRRVEAIDSLYAYSNRNFSDDRLVIVGDMNDNIAEEPAKNVFQTFINDSLSYRFTDMGIAKGSSLFFSYPSYNPASHLDHILISSELFSEYFETKTVLYDTYLDGRWTEYEENISDHRPVSISLIIKGE